MEPEEIYRFVESAEEALPLLEGFAQFYSRTLERYNHSEDAECSLEEMAHVSEELLRETTRHAVEIVPEYKKGRRQLESVLEEVDEVSDHLVIEGQKWKNLGMEERVEQTISDYTDVLNTIWCTGYRIKEQTDLEPNPIDMRLKRWRREQEGFIWNGDVGEVEKGGGDGLRVFQQMF